MAHRIDDFSSTAGHIRNDLAAKFDMVQARVEDKISGLQTTITQEKQKIAGVLQQSELTTREMERFMKVSNKDFETLLLAEITKREKNSRMVIELDKSVQDICTELDSRLTHNEKRQ